ncbi:MAG: BrnA antitoxin family protein [bacterium]|nr:BrnA antitoxin family protein [bacterium]
MKKKIKKIPKFKNKAEERRFWKSHDSGEYIDWSKAKRAQLPKLHPSTKSRLPIALLENLRIAANNRDVPYQSYATTRSKTKGQEKKKSLSSDRK